MDWNYILLGAGALLVAYGIYQQSLVQRKTVQGSEAEIQGPVMCPSTFYAPHTSVSEDSVVIGVNRVGARKCEVILDGGTRVIQYTEGDPIVHKNV